jgi:ParB-like nuclease family protein
VREFWNILFAKGVPATWHTSSPDATRGNNGEAARVPDLDTPSPGGGGLHGCTRPGIVSRRHVASAILGSQPRRAGAEPQTDNPCNLEVAAARGNAFARYGTSPAERVPSRMNELTVAQLPVGSLKPYDRNARTHSAKQIAQIAASITAFGFNNPVLVDKEGGIIAGHGRVEAARSCHRAVRAPRPPR